MKKISDSLFLLHLKQLLAILTDNYEANMFSAAFTLAFFVFLRVGEITVCSLNKIGH